MRRRNHLVAILIATSVLLGCSRHHYRVRADSDGYGRVLEKAWATPWLPPSNYSVYPPQHSRLHDPTNIEDPCLPIPSPQLYAYDLPDLPPRDNARFTPEHGKHAHEQEHELPSPEPLEAPTPAPGDGYAFSNAETHPKPDTESTAPDDRPFLNVSHRASDPRESASLAPSVLAQTDSASAPSRTEAAYQARLLQHTGVATNAEAPVELANESVDGSTFDDSPRTKLVPLPKSYWEPIPGDCLARMLEFETVRAEYEATYGRPPSSDLLDDSPRLALEDIIDLTLLNSRELQTQKEALFRTALALTLERFDYQLRPSVGGNGTAALYDHNRSGGMTDDSLAIPSALDLQKMLYTGGDFLGRFANSVLLTFNGPQGFAADVSSELLFGLSQSLLQRDVRLENLTQAERNVVYAARDFTRFRRELFVQQASDYYSLIRQFRQIEINCQNYFTLAREFNQRSVEIRFGFAARTQLDQVEQQVINGRQSILSTCTALENALDGLKVRMGIPTEQPLNLDLSELNLLTLRDELAVTAELIERTRRRIEAEQQSETGSAPVIIGALTQLVETMLTSIELREKLGANPPDPAGPEETLLALRVESADVDVYEVEQDLQQVLNEPNPFPTRVFQRRRDVVGELLRKVGWQIRWLHRVESDRGASDRRMERLDGFVKRLDQLERDFFAPLETQNEAGNDILPEGVAVEAPETRLVNAAASLQEEVYTLAAELDQRIGRTVPGKPTEFRQRALELATELLEQSESYRDTAGGGLVPIQIEMDDAMMTALVQRFDLMNERGFLADDWRQIKYAADDLRSVLNLEASQSVRTRNGENRPFDFTFDDSTTSLGVTLDLPFNRRAQRNQYRASLFNYQSALRNVMQLEDNIKLSVRRDLRTLTLDRQQYGNDIAGAALASERVTGTELEVRGGFATSRDFLESQTAYVQAVSNVASRHINYIVGRLQLFLDMESLTVGDNGFWDELYDEHLQPQPNYELPDYEPAYGRLHPRLKYSRRIRRMRCVPNGQAMIHNQVDTAALESPSMQ